MIVAERGSLLRLLLWQWRHVALFIVSAALIKGAHDFLDWTWLTLPNPPVLIVGGALGIFVSFRTNSAYDRWWEGRKLWGRMVNSSRHLADQLVSYLPDRAHACGKPAASVMVHRHAAYVHALRCLLRLQDPYEDADVQRSCMAGELETYRGRSNLTHALLERQHREVAAIARDGGLDGHQVETVDLTLRALLDIQGGCERIKKTPLPRVYGFIAERLIQAYGLLFPLALTEELGWMVIPVNVLVCLSFTLISEVGRVLEDPFNMFYNGLPLHQMSTMIEVNIRETLGETELPPIPGPNKRGILM